MCIGAGEEGGVNSAREFLISFHCDTPRKLLFYYFPRPARLRESFFSPSVCRSAGHARRCERALKAEVTQDR